MQTMLLSRRGLQSILGLLWLVDGFLQLQPRMYTMNMVNGVMKPMLVGQPGFLEPSLQYIVNTTTQNLTAVNLLIAVVQIALGLGFIFSTGPRVKQLVVVSIIWALIVWYGGEGLSMLLTGTSSILSGAPGAVLLYPLLGFAIWPRKGDSSAATATLTMHPASTTADIPSPSTLAASANGLISRNALRWALAGFWFFAALLQLQPNWWQDGQISGTIGGMVGAGGFNGVLVDPVLTLLSNATASIEVPLNIALIVVFLALGIGLAWPHNPFLRAFLGASIVVSVLVWYTTQAFGMIFSGMATDFNSGLLLVVLALAVWPRREPSVAQAAQPGQAESELTHAAVHGSGLGQAAEGVN